jgi:hypothetical protein
LIVDALATDAPIDPLKLESILIEGRIQQVIEDLKICSRQDYSIGSERRDSDLSSVLSQLGLDPDELAARRPCRRCRAEAAVDAAGARAPPG